MRNDSIRRDVSAAMKVKVTAKGKAPAAVIPKAKPKRDISAHHRQHIDTAAQTICGKSYSIQANEKLGTFRVIVAGVTHPAGKLPIRFKSLGSAIAHIVNHSPTGSYRPISCAVRG